MTNVEIKARFRFTPETEETLRSLGAVFSGTERQVDTYFGVEAGMLKIRERDGEEAQLIQYVRETDDGPRPSHFTLVHLKDPDRIFKTLEDEHGIRCVVRKVRRIWMWKNVRIHFDEVEKLGAFIELEGVVSEDAPMQISEDRVFQLMDRFGISRKDLIYQSYSDFFESPDSETGAPL